MAKRMVKGGRKNKKHGEKPISEKCLADTLRSRGFTVSYLRKVISNKEKDDGTRTKAGTLLEILDKKEAGEIYLELLGNNENSVWLRCSAMAFFIRDKNVFDSPDMLEKLIYGLSRLAHNYGEETEVIIKQAAATLEIIYSRRMDDTVSRKSKELLASYAEY